MTRRTFILFTKHRIAKPGRLISFVCRDRKSSAKGKRRHKSASYRGKKPGMKSDVAIFESQSVRGKTIPIIADRKLSP